jgi:hypothetical protein
MITVKVIDPDELFADSSPDEACAGAATAAKPTNNGVAIFTNEQRMANLLKRGFTVEF